MKNSLVLFLVIIGLSACGQLPESLSQDIPVSRPAPEEIIEPSIIIFNSPLNGEFRMSSAFNPDRVHPVTGEVRPHTGTDWAAPLGTPVLAVSAGIVEAARFDDRFGSYVVLNHGEGVRSAYAHLNSFDSDTPVGSFVSAGAMIATVGSTGWSTGPHLHFEIWMNDVAVDPQKFVGRGGFALPISTGGGLAVADEIRPAALLR